MRQFTKEWLKASTDDLYIIEEIKHIEHLTHMTAFHAQQSIEKSFKALIEEYEIDIPKIHKLLKLQFILDEKMKKFDEEILSRLDELYIDSRYPGDMGLLPNGKPTLEDSKVFYDFAYEIFESTCSQLNIEKSEFMK